MLLSFETRAILLEAPIHGHLTPNRRAPTAPVSRPDMRYRYTGDVRGGEGMVRADTSRRSNRLCTEALPTAAPVHAVSPSPQGISRKACPQTSTSCGEHPGGTPRPAIFPESLTKVARVNCRLELGGTNVFRSIMGWPSSQRNACKNVLQSDDPPTTCPLALMPLAMLQGSLAT